MSRITDYVLEPNVLYTGDGFFIRVKVQDDYKYKKYLVSESMKYTTATGTTFTLTNAVSTNNASILQLEGNTTQNGTPTPTSPIPIYTVSGDNEVVVCNKNFFQLEPYTDRGITFTQNDDSDKSITINGTATTTYCSVPSNKRVSCYLEPNTYTYSINKTVGHNRYNGK